MEIHVIACAISGGFTWRFVPARLARAHNDMHEHARTSHLLMDVLRGENSRWDWGLVVCAYLLCVSECVCEGGGGGGGACIRQSHTQLCSPGDHCQPVILPCTPPSFLSVSTPHYWNRSTTYNARATRSKQPPTRCYLYRGNKEKQAGPPLWTERGRVPGDRHSQPQHPDLSATTTIQAATPEWSRIDLTWENSTSKICTKIFVPAKESRRKNTRENALNNVYCVYFGQSLRHHHQHNQCKGAGDGGGERWRLVEEGATSDVLPQLLPQLLPQPLKGPHDHKKSDHTPLLVGGSALGHAHSLPQTSAWSVTSNLNYVKVI